MFTKIIVIVSFILFGLMAFLLILNDSYRYRLNKQSQEIEALTHYVKTLQEKVREQEQDEVEKVEIPKDLKIRELLDSYLQERERNELSPDTPLTTEELQQDLSEFQLKQRFVPNLVPLKARYAISQEYSDNHKGIDLAAPLGTEVVATAAGVVKSVYEDRYFGYVIVIDHLHHYLTFYAHLARIFPEQGYFVEKGETIGLVGSTGFSTNPHLHYEVFYLGNNIDPEKLVDFK